jgi:hypothetical protein
MIVKNSGNGILTELHIYSPSDYEKMGFGMPSVCIYVCMYVMCVCMYVCLFISQAPEWLDEILGI